MLNDADKKPQINEQVSGYAGRTEPVVFKIEVQTAIQSSTTGDSADPDPDHDLYENITNSSPATTPKQPIVVAHEMQSLRHCSCLK